MNSPVMIQRPLKDPIFLTIFHFLSHGIIYNFYYFFLFSSFLDLDVYTLSGLPNNFLNS